MRKLTLGIVAHVDAGKTSLTERLLFDAGVLRTLGSVDDGSTTTDSMSLERRRGITIRSAVATFPVAAHQVQLIDTPGHVDFVAEVERALGVLDGAVLVLSAVEGVQAHTRSLMRILRALHVPTILFVNKIDRAGARDDDLFADIRRLLGPAAIRVNRPTDPGTKHASVTAVEPDTDWAEVLAERSDAVLQSYVDGLDPVLLRAELAAQARSAQVFPVLFGSAITGVGVAALREAIVEFFPATDSADPELAQPLSGTVFAVERDRSGRRLAVARLFSGSLAARDEITYARHDPFDGTLSATGRPTGVFTVDGDRPARIGPGGIARIAGIPGLWVGDRLGSADVPPAPAWFRPPTLETVVTPRHPGDAPALFTGLAGLADQDPLINLRRGPAPGSLVVSLYGEVQREVIADRLAEEYGVAADFAPASVVCVERVAGTGVAVERIGDTRPVLFWATIGLRVEPGEPDSGVRFRLEAERGSLPPAFLTAIEDTVRATLREGRCGWQVVDCVITLTHTGFASMFSTAGDFRGLTPLVLAAALCQAGTVVCEPLDRVTAEVPEDALSPVLGLLARAGGAPETPVVHGGLATIEAVLPSARLPEIERALPGLTAGAGVLTSRFAGHRPVPGRPPTRARAEFDPFDRDRYLRQWQGRESVLG